MLSRFHLIPERNGRTDRTDGRTYLLYQYRDKNARWCWLGGSRERERDGGQLSCTEKIPCYYNDDGRPLSTALFTISRFVMPQSWTPVSTPQYSYVRARLSKRCMTSGAAIMSTWQTAGRRGIEGKDGESYWRQTQHYCGETAYHSMQTIPQSSMTMTTMLDRTMTITIDIVAIATASSSLSVSSLIHDNFSKIQHCVRAQKNQAEEFLAYFR